MSDKNRVHIEPAGLGAEERQTSAEGPVMSLNLFGHRFTDFKSVERICWTCGYVVPRAPEPETRRWMAEHEGGLEPHCGGAWHLVRREPRRAKAEGRS